MATLPVDDRPYVTVNGTGAGRFAVTIESEGTYETVRTDRPSLDCKWRYVDEHGHEHSGDDLAATLRDVLIPCYCDAVYEPHDIHDHWECRMCGEVIKPGTVPPGTFTLRTGTYSKMRLTGSSVALVLKEVLSNPTLPADLAITSVDGSVTSIRAVYRESGASNGSGYVEMDVI